VNGEANESTGNRRAAIVTGGGRGIGRGIALALAKAGYDVGISFRNSEDGAREVRKAVEALGRRCADVRADVSNTADIARIFDELVPALGRLDVLVNNAGVTRLRPFLDITEELWNEVTATDWKGAFFATQRGAREMIARGTPGVIVNITSNQQEGCWPGGSVYGPSKAALLKFTRHAALELAPHGIRVVAVAPGYTLSRDDADTRAGRIPARIPLQRFAVPKEVGDAVVFLASDAASYVTGTCLTMDGGALLPVVPENALT
jgi:NAD(P)-dependent dehydrogenase (short-subunit alcohol dehydrogenase family)